MDLSKTIDEIGKYFNEILGYLLPGLAFVFLIYFFIDPNQIVNVNIDTNLSSWFILFNSYITGYIVYGFSMLRNRILKIKRVENLSVKKGFSFLKDSAKVTIKQICESQEFNITKTKLGELIPEIDTTKLDFYSVRNFAMAYVPEVDQKIYTFMFRADLFDHIKVIFYLIFIWGLAGYVSFILFNNNLLFNATSNNIYLLILLLAFAYPLKLGRLRFLRIAYNIQFHIFLAKFHQGQN